MIAEATAARPTFAGEAVDMVSLNEVIEHANDDVVALREAYGLAPLDGHVVYTPKRLYAPVTRRQVHPDFDIVAARSILYPVEGTTPTALGRWRLLALRARPAEGNDA